MRKEAPALPAMRIAFLCACLEPGRDGVGDYCRRLADECVRQGHTVALVALNDPYQSEDGLAEEVSARIGGDGDDADEKKNVYDVLRLGTDLPWSERVRRGAAFLRQFAPDWLSLQFVSFGFHPKGFAWKTTDYLLALKREAGLSKTARTHVMVHEIWVGELPWQRSPRRRLVGLAQKRAVLRLLARLQPAALHTTNAWYQRRLTECGFPQTRLLPLFGNIPVGVRDENSTERALSLISEGGVSIAPEERPRWLLCGLFGLIDAGLKDALIDALITAGRASGRTVLVASIGRKGQQGQGIWENLVARYGSAVRFADVGERDPVCVSHFLAEMDLCGTPVSQRVVGKSGTIAAMIDHGLPVVVTNLDPAYALPSDARSQTLIHLVSENLAPQIARGLPRLAPEPSLPRVTQIFLQDLSAASVAS